MSCPGPADTCAKSVELLKDGVGNGDPLEWLAVGVVRGHEVINSLDELLDADERTPADRLICDQRGESLDLIQPGVVGWDEVHVPARSRRQPRLDCRSLEAACCPHRGVTGRVSF